MKIPLPSSSRGRSSPLLRRCKARYKTVALALAGSSLISTSLPRTASAVDPDTSGEVRSSDGPPAAAVPDDSSGGQSPSSAAVPVQESASDSWPGVTWLEASPEEVGIDPARLQGAFDYAFARTGDDKDRKGIRTDGVVIIREGKLIREQYARGYTPASRHLAWSVAKSFVNALYGIAAKDGLVRLEDPAYRYFPALDRDPHRKITVADLLQMSSGLSWDEGYESSPVKSNVLQMLYTAGRRDMAGFVASQPVALPPGTHWMYSSGTTNLLMGMLKQVVSEERYASWPWERLFDVLQMHHVVLERDQAGTFIGSSYLYATPRDMARLGLLYLRDGVWGGTRLLPEGWVKWTTTLVPGARTIEYKPGSEPDSPGAHWWLNVPQPDRNIPRPWPDVPEDAYAAQGHWGQYIFVIPSYDLVVVRVGDDRDGSFSENLFLKHILDSIQPETAKVSP